MNYEPTTIIDYLVHDLNGKLRSANPNELDQWSGNVRSLVSVNPRYCARTTYYFAAAFAVLPVKPLATYIMDDGDAEYNFKNLEEWPQHWKDLRKGIRGRYRKTRKKLSHKIHKEIIADLQKAEKAETFIDLSDGKIEERFLLPIGLFYEGSVSTTHLFSVFIQNSKGESTECGSCVFGPRGWFPDKQLTNNLLRYRAKKVSPFGFEKTFQSKKLAAFFDYLNDADLLLPYFICMAAQSQLDQKGKQRTIQIKEATREYLEKTSNTKSTHYRRSHESFMWVRESNVQPFEPIYGRQIRKNTLVKVRRVRAATVVGV